MSSHKYQQGSLERAREQAVNGVPFSGITSGDDGQYQCHQCGTGWKAESLYAWWPIQLKWKRGTALSFFDWHGWQVGSDGIERPVFGQTFHIGPLKICFGKSRAEDGDVIPPPR